MKKWVAALAFCSFSVLAAPKDVLSDRLALTDGFSAKFQQKVISPDGEVVVDGNGYVNISRPNLFRWETKTPDENLLVSDGKTLWYYNPFIEQVTIYNPDQATEQTPFVLLTRNRKSDWDAYRVQEKGDVFTLIPTDADTNQGQFQIDITAKGIVKGFNVIEQDGQKSLFTFSDVKVGKPEAGLFIFQLPEGVEVDDQRK
ncbi:outer membrane lipoprotein chaperone LolA [Vibrio nitrifigilis]|uniref:Outer-membrane lipoprotein carrier protein n=1 Tax=Vibrio nitrifigilis TaxID=2789781 RepID=A0ABS0GEH6_9VIBR|nr:outer membrane lipoprotein chaperone LolA [Vibrio nitrifigilis]MBF9000819.1 outer membrane lipoprotein chaperone LolA [Vibrio nitrifigilis]